MSEEKNSKLEEMDEFDQKIMKQLTEELSDIRVSEELIQKTLQAAGAGQQAQENRAEAWETNFKEESSQQQVSALPKKSRECRKLRLMRNCTAAAAALLLVVLGARAMQFGTKTDGENFSTDEKLNMAESSGASSEEWSNTDYLEQENEYFTNGGGSMDGAVREEPAVNDEAKEGCDSASCEQLTEEIENGGWEMTDEINFDPEKTAPDDSDENISGGAEYMGAEKQMLLTELAGLLVNSGEEDGVIWLNGFSDNVREGTDYREFAYQENNLEITCRVYAEGRLEAELLQNGETSYRAVEGWYGAEYLWQMQDIDE